MVEKTLGEEGEVHRGRLLRIEQHRNCRRQK
jgi:hypothetical protein